MPDRRYTDAEVAEIFRRATTDPAPAPHAAEGFSLAELQAIGSEAGIAPVAVADAARSLEMVEPVTTDTLLGLPIAVRHAVELGREIRDAEWDRLVVAARETFRAEGRIRHEGSIRQWSNSNLRMWLEPGTRGHRLRFQTLNGHARRMILSGIAALGLATVVSVATLASGVPDPIDRLTGMMIVAVAGAAMLTRGVWGLRNWAARRAAEFRELAGKVKGGE